MIPIACSLCSWKAKAAGEDFARLAFDQHLADAHPGYIEAMGLVSAAIRRDSIGVSTADGKFHSLAEQMIQALPITLAKSDEETWREAITIEDCRYLKKLRIDPL